MALTETVTIINNSGKIITNGKHLWSIFKEAKASYQEKKAAVKAERAVRRSNTYDVATVPNYYEEVEYLPPNVRRISNDDAQSYASSHRSHRSRQSRGSQRRSQSHTRSSLTESNLRTLTEVSATAPSRPPVTYRSPYAETAPRDMAISRPTLAHAPTMPMTMTEKYTPISTPRQSMYVQRSVSNPALRKKKEKEIDMNLAYGNIPPDLEHRVDLDPAYKAAEKEKEARNLTQKIESLLVEAQCVHHTATHMIEHLQKNPEAAAAVALTLAELSTLLGKMSPAFIGAIKAGSPAVFSLLASPQFLIAAGLTVGVTVIMFGGWKIVKRIKEAQAEAMMETPMAFEAHTNYAPPPPQQQQPRPPYPVTEDYDRFDEALVLEEELSTIETWRRGIPAFEDDEAGDQESVDLELISPEADRAIRSQIGDDARSVRTSRTHRTSKSSKSHKSHRTREVVDDDIPERKSSRAYTEVDRESLADSERSRRSHRSDRTHQSSKSRRTVKAIEDGSRDKENSIEMVIRPKKDNMLKSLFKKKKEKDERSKVESMLSLA